MANPDKRTFNLPDISDCFIQGGTPGIKHSAGAPNIIGILNPGDRRFNTGAVRGCFYSTTEGNAQRFSSQSSATTDQAVGFDASLSSSVYGNSNTVQPKSVEMHYYVKY